MYGPQLRELAKSDLGSGHITDNNDKDQVKISHYVHFQGHILILGEVIGNQILGKT